MQFSPATNVQFSSAVDSGFWSMGWFGYKDVNYRPGQGTVWVFTDSKKAKETMTMERALLKVNADSLPVVEVQVRVGARTPSCTSSSWPPTRR